MTEIEESEIFQRQAREKENKTESGSGEPFFQTKGASRQREKVRERESERAGGGRSEAEENLCW